MHLRMTGNLLLRPADLAGAGEDAALDLMEARKFGGPRLYETHPEARHLRALIRLESGDEVWFTDPRRFGTGGVFEGEALDAYLDARLGIEPLSDDLTAEALLALAGNRTAPLKSFLLSQDGVAGIGNIYADEALHIAGLHPLSPAGSMKPEHAEALRVGIVAALEAGLENSGASMNDYVDARGEKGSMQDAFLVHTREGGDCPRCGGTIERIVVGGRSTYFCPDCQVKLRRRPRRRAAGRAHDRAAHPRGVLGRALERPGGRHRLHRDPRAAGLARRRRRSRRRHRHARDGRHRPAHRHRAGERDPPHRRQRLRPRRGRRRRALARGARARLHDARRAGADRARRGRLRPRRGRPVRTARPGFRVRGLRRGRRRRARSRPRRGGHRDGGGQGAGPRAGHPGGDRLCGDADGPGGDRRRDRGRERFRRRDRAGRDPDRGPHGRGRRDALDRGDPRRHGGPARLDARWRSATRPSCA